MTPDSAMEVTETPLEPMEDSNTSSSGEESESGGQEAEDMEGSDQDDEHEEEEEEKAAANPAFSKFMQGFWDLASVDVPVRCVAYGDGRAGWFRIKFFHFSFWMDLL